MLESNLPATAMAGVNDLSLDSDGYPVIPLVDLPNNAVDLIVWLDAWNIKLEIPAHLNDHPVFFSHEDRRAAWKLYVELATRLPVATMPSHANSEMVMTNLFSLYDTIRQIMKEASSFGQTFAILGIAFLNQHLTPFYSRWDAQLSSNPKLELESERDSILYEIQELRRNFRVFAAMLANVGAFTDILAKIPKQEPSKENDRFETRSNWMQHSVVALRPRKPWMEMALVEIAKHEELYNETATDIVKKYVCKNNREFYDRNRHESWPHV